MLRHPEQRRARHRRHTIFTVGDYVIHNFTFNGTFTVTDSSLTEVEVLVVGGGGGGGSDIGGGGGGGAVLCSVRDKTLSSSLITVTVGIGGTGGWALAIPMVAPAPLMVWWQMAGRLVLVIMLAGQAAPERRWIRSLVLCGWRRGERRRTRRGRQQQSEILSYDKGGDGGPGVESSISGTSNYYGGGGGGGVYNYNNRVAVLAMEDWAEVLQEGR